MTPGDFDTVAELEALVAKTSDVITVLDEAGVVQYQSPSAAEVLGYDAEKLVGETAFDYVHEDDREKVIEMFLEMVEAPDETTKRVEFRFDHPEKGWVWLEAIGTNQVSAAFDGYVVTSRDVTERKRREAKLQQYQAAMETVPDGVFMLDENGTIIRSNRAWADIVGTDREEMRGESFETLVEEGFVAEETVERYLGLVKTLLSEDTDRRRGSFTTRVDRPEETERIYEVHIGLLPTDESGSFRGTAGVVRDITERVRRRERLKRENERLNEFADILSHDLRNPLNVLRTSLDLLEESDHRDRCLRAVDRMDQLVDDLLALAQSDDAVTGRDQLHVETVAERAWDTVVTENLELDVRADGTIEADAGQLQQLFENLFRNCVEHARTGENDPVTVTVDLREDRLVVADDGTGFDDVDPDRLFESGYSTSEEGTGFGLSIVEQIANAHGWDVYATERDEDGARFVIEGV